ncbi:MAG: hotdog fold domain-containing protein [Candidatus Absconditabacteria bacterium]
MTNLINKYGDVSGGYIFDFLDIGAHEYAEKLLGKCVTASANIQYFLPLKNETQLNNYKCEIVNSGNKTVTVNAFIKIEEKMAVMAVFTFVKIK